MHYPYIVRQNGSMLEAYCPMVPTLATYAQIHPSFGGIQKVHERAVESIGQAILDMYENKMAIIPPLAGTPAATAAYIEVSPHLALKIYIYQAMQMLKMGRADLAKLTRFAPTKIGKILDPTVNTDMDTLVDVLNKMGYTTAVVVFPKG